MPYNTRRKSLSLPSLGIHIPSSHAARAANRQSSNNTSSGTSPNPIPSHSHGNGSATTSSLRTSPSSESDHRHPAKKMKRSHDDSANSPASTSAVAPSPALSRPGAVKYEHTPPPSPGLEPSIEMDEADASEVAPARKIDLEGINDDIVEAVIIRLQDTANRPHLVKELASVLMETVKIVQQSANPCAIISSRLSTYLKRSCWSAIAPCPLAKELETVHPRRTYFYLTTCRHQPLPDPATANTAAAQLAQRTFISPSLSSAPSTSEDADIDRTRELSMSPEVDLSSPEFDDMDDDVPMPTTPMGSVSGRHRPLSSMPRTQRGGSPPLEKDEKEFTQTADGLQKRKLSGLLAAEPVDNVMEVDETTRDEQLFGEPRGLMPSLVQQMAFATSPAIRPSMMMPIKKDGEVDGWSKLDAILDWDRSPENIELDELDGLLNGF